MGYSGFHLGFSRVEMHAKKLFHNPQPQSSKSQVEPEHFWYAYDPWATGIGILI